MISVQPQSIDGRGVKRNELAKQLRIAMTVHHRLLHIKMKVVPV